MKSLVGLLLYMAQRDKSKPISILEGYIHKLPLDWLGSKQCQ